MDSLESEPDPLRSSPKVRLPIVCRHNPFWWWVVVPYLFVSGLLFWSPSIPDPKHPGHSPWSVAVICWPMALILLVALLALVFDLRCGEIRADETGLTWRRYFGRRRSARWEEITDFYFKSHGNAHIVVTPRSNLELSERFYNIKKIIDFLPQRASAVGKSGWEEKAKWWSPQKPIVIKAWSGEDKWVAPLMTGGILWAMVSSVLNPPKPRGHRIPHQSLEVDFAHSLLLNIPVAIFFAFTLSALVQWWREWNFFRHLKGVEVRLNSQGITYKSPLNTVTAQWKEVLAVTYLDRQDGFIPIEFRTTQGNFVIWWSGFGIGMWPKVRRRTRLLAPGLLATHEATWLLQALDGDRGAWTGGAAGQGIPRWSFRSRANQLVCQGISVVAPCVPFVYWLNSLDESKAAHVAQSQGSWLTLVGLCVGALMVILGSWFWYFRSAVVADEDALEMRFPFGLRRRAAWRDIENQGRDACGDFVKAKGRKMHFTWFVAPVRVEELRDYIEAQIRVHSR